MILNANAFQLAKSLFHLPLTQKEQDNLLAGYTGNLIRCDANGFFYNRLCEYLNNLW